MPSFKTDRKENVEFKEDFFMNQTALKNYSENLYYNHIRRLFT